MLPHINHTPCTGGSGGWRYKQNAAAMHTCTPSGSAWLDLPIYSYAVHERMYWYAPLVHPPAHRCHPLLLVPS